MKLAIIHLSDIHFRGISSDYEADRRLANDICSAVRPELIGSTHAIILVSGDIAYSGLDTEYRYANDWLSHLYMKIDDGCPATCWILCAPGNHDVDHSEARPLRAAVIQQLHQNPSISSDKQIMNECTKEQSAFFQFRNDIEGKGILVYDDPLLRIHRLRDGDSTVQINILNSAWMSSMHEEQGSLIFPYNSYEEQLATPDGFAISVIHHPLAWFTTENSRMLRSELPQCSSIIVCGHEHMPDSTEILTRLGDQVRFVDGGVMKTDGSSDSSFNLLLLDTDANKMKEYTFRHTGTRYESETASNWEDVTRLKSSESGRFRLTTGQRTKLEEIGINILHPRKEQISLRDLFVFPDLLPVSTDHTKAKDRWDRNVSAENLLFDTKHTHTILEGDEGSGKTALLRMYFSEFYKRGKIPIYLHGSDLTVPDDGDMRASLRISFEGTYEGEDFTQYEQLDPSERVLLVDDLDLGSRMQDNLTSGLTFIQQFFGKAILITNDMLSFQKLAAEEQAQAIMTGYQYFCIQEFGHVKRDELIKRWIMLGRQSRDWNSVPTLSERDNARTALNTTIGRNFMPSYPVIILIIMQSRETGASSPIGSTYGHHYQFLITRSLFDSGVMSEDLDAVSNYICELAYAVYYVKQQREINTCEYDTWHSIFCKEYGVGWNAEHMRSTLERASILSVNAPGSIYFRYPYVYFFFLAKKLSMCLGEVDIRDRVQHMCERLHIVEYANIILFLIHHSSDQFVLDSVRRSASVLLKEQPPFGLEVSSSNQLLSSINQLSSKLGVPILEERNPDREQEKVLRGKDVVETGQRKLEGQLSQLDGDLETTVDGLDVLAQAGVAAKTVELLGQTLRNYYGSLKVDTKVELGRDAIDLSLRALAALFELFVSDEFSFVDLLVESRRDYEREHLKSYQRKSEEELQQWARDWMFTVSRLIAHGILRKVGSALAFDQLRPTLHSLVPSNASLAYRIVEVAALLDGPTGIPKDKIESIAQEFNNNPLGFQLLRDFAVQHVYRYPTEYRDKQWLAEKLNLSMVGQRSAELDGSRRMINKPGRDSNPQRSPGGRKPSERRR